MAGIALGHGPPLKGLSQRHPDDGLQDKRDIYYREAKHQGFRARSAFKLIQRLDCKEVEVWPRCQVMVIKSDMEAEHGMPLVERDHRGHLFPGSLYDLSMLCSAKSRWNGWIIQGSMRS